MKNPNLRLPRRAWLLGAGGVLAGGCRRLRISETQLTDGDVSAGPFPKLIRDPTGQGTILPRPPTRIVSAVVAADEMLADLVPFERLAGVSRFVDDPTSSLAAGTYPPSIPRVAGSVEVILALNPDLVVLAGFSRSELVFPLLASGVPVVRLRRYDAWQDLLDNLQLVGRAVGKEPEAATLVERAQMRLQTVQRLAQGRLRPRVLVWQQGGYTVGAGTLIDELLQYAGARNVVREMGGVGYFPLNDEVVVGLRPDVLVVSTPKTEPQAHAVGLLPDTPTWHALEAVRAGRVLGVPAAWMSAVSPGVVQVAEALVGWLHPKT